MTARQRDVMLFAGVLCFVAAGFLVSLVVGFVVMGVCLLAAVYLLTPDSIEEPEREANDGQ